MLTKAALVAALNDDRDQDIGEFRAARDHIFITLLDDAANDPRYDAAHAEARVRSLFGPSPSDIEGALAKLKAARSLFDGH